MFRKSALAMAMLGALATGNVVALGLGEIELKSSLNQPLNAEVELLSATEAELQELKVNIGSNAAFAEAGIDRPIFLTKLKFAVKTNAGGKPVVLITSREVVQEPFLDFLLEVSWSKGRLLREYTVLVDPPVTMPAAAPVYQAPPTQAATPSAQAAPSYQAPRGVTHTAQMPPVSVAPGQYGPTKRNDTLWKIASQVRPDTGVSMEQTMLSLLRANPEAFQENNINNLKAGYILRVPSREDMLSVGRAEALREARAQHAAWRAARGLSQPEATSAPASLAEPSLKLVSPDAAGGGLATGGMGAEAELSQLQNELLMANEALEEQRRLSEDMSSRLSVLEEQIVNMQRLIQLKDEELARLQAQAGAEAMEPAASELEVGEALSEADELAETPLAAEAVTGLEDEALTADPMIAGEDLDSDAMLDETATDLDSETAFDDTLADAAVADTEEIAAPAAEGLTEDLVDEEVTAAEPAVEPEPQPAVVEPVLADPVPAPSLIDQILSKPLWLGAGGAVLALLAFFVLRRRQGVETEFQESILQAAHEDSAAASDSELVAAEPVASQPVSSESSMLSEFAVSDMGSIKNDGEADPLAEADVYLAYGRFQQAEDLIKEALEKDADREDLNLKLLEIYLAGRNTSAFDKLAQDILGRLESSDDPTWEKIAEMGRELSPKNPLYQPGGAAGLAAENEAEMEPLPEALDLDPDAGLSEGADETAFNVDFKSDEETVEEALDGMESADKGLDFDLDLSFDAEAGEDKQPDTLEFTPPAETPDEPEVAVSESNQAVDTVDVDALEFDLESLDLDSEGDEEAELEGDGLLADMDEVSTKLDLARAYIDMGDPDGAKNILDEVMDEGTDDQKDEARGIMAQM